MHPLDNVIWQALTTRQAQFAQSFENAKRFVPEVSPLAAFKEECPEGYASLAGLLPPHDTIGIFLDHPCEPRPGWVFVAGAPLLQMVYENGSVPTNGSVANPDIEELGEKNSPEMMELTKLTKPGPFSSRTHEFGTYLGIRLNGKLVAMAGERLKVPGYTEVSAVCTHPDYTGKGYASVLMIKVMRGVHRRGEIPFLHVREDNIRAIEIYRRLGFRTRQLRHFAVLRKE
jgi:ribosomal protein S18 acetylase RimI-like enzyme